MEATETVQPPTRPLDRVLPGAGVFLSRAVFYILLGMIGATILWMGLTDVDVVVQSRGRIVVEGEPVRISVPESGMVIDVGTSVGARVGKGDVLLKLDPFKVTSEAVQLESEIRAVRAESARHRESAKANRDVLETVKSERALTVKTSDIIAGQVKALKDLLLRGSASVFQVDQKEQELNEARARLVRLDAEFKRSENAADLEERQALEGDARLDGLVAKLKLLHETERQMTLTSPVAGTVTRLAVLHPGSYLGSSEQAVVIMPDDRPLRASLQIPNASMRRLRSTMKVKMRFDAYPYQDWGFIEGEILRIDPDADAEGSYRAWVSLARPDITGPRGVEKLRPGLQLQADIIVERRTILDFALTPFKRLNGPVSVTE
jgi:HlyD family secretion protein